MSRFLEEFERRVLLADGGIASELYRRGIFINQCYENLNLANPKLIQEIHQEYHKAGADILCTNTYGANAIKLKSFQLDSKVAEINQTAVDIIRKSTSAKIFIAGTIGTSGLEYTKDNQSNKNEIERALTEQAAALISAGVDLIILDSFKNADELELVYNLISKLNHKVHVIPYLDISSFQIASHMREIVSFIEQMYSWGANIIGVQHIDGVKNLLSLVTYLHDEWSHTAKEKIKIAAMLSYGKPEYIDDRYLYMTTPEYFSEYTRRMIEKGLRLINTSYGIVPGHIKELKKFIRSKFPVRENLEVVQQDEKQSEIQPPAVHDRTPFGAKLGKKFCISVELDPPPGLDPKKSVEGAKFLYEHGIDAVNIADGPRAIARMGPAPMALLVKEAVPIETVIHYCCRDRNLLGMQMDLIGANALGLKNILCITGDPPKMGNYPDATAVFDVDAIGLLKFADRLNHGYDLGGKFLGEATQFVLGCGCNPGAIDLDREAERYGKKIEAGAEFVFSQPVYDPELLYKFLEKTKQFKPIPFFVGILPLASLKNAEFLTKEVPGMQVPEKILARLRMASTKEDQREEGIRIAQEALSEAKKSNRIQGAYIFPPFGRYEAILEVIKVL